MKIKTFIKFIITLVCLTASFNANAQSRTNSYKYIANTSAKIVKGNITVREAVTYKLEGKTLTCGWLLDIKVNQSWKGGDDNFTIFSTNSDILLGDGFDYFIFVKKNNKFAATKQKIEFVICDGFNSIRLDVSPYKYFATSINQQIFPIVSYDAQDNIIDQQSNLIKRGQWMLILDRISNHHLPDSIRIRRLNIGNEKILEEMSFPDFLKEFIITP